MDSGSRRTGGACPYVRLEAPSPAPVGGSPTQFTLANTPATGTLVVFLNGLALNPGASNDYTRSGTTLTLSSNLTPLDAYDRLRVSYLTALPSGVTQITSQTPTPAVDGVTRIFSFTGMAGTETVHLNGVTLRPGPGNDYTVSGSVITMAVPPATTDLLLIDAYTGWSTVVTFTGPSQTVYSDLVEGRTLGRVTAGVSVEEYGSDALGSVTSYWDGHAGTLEASIRYKPYGETVYLHGTGADGALYVATEGYDSLTRLYAQISAGYRIYDYDTGRFITKDPSGVWGGLNLFEYADSNPVMRTDTLGLQTGYQDLLDRAEHPLKDMLDRQKGQRALRDVLEPTLKHLVDEWSQNGDPVLSRIVSDSRLTPEQKAILVQHRWIFLNAAYERSHPSPVEDDPDDAIEEPSFGVSLIPVWGQIRQAQSDLSHGRIGWGLADTFLAVSDVFLLKSLLTAPAKIAWKIAAEKLTAEEGARGGEKLTVKAAAHELGIWKQGSHTWPATSKWARRVIIPEGSGITRHIAEEGDVIHHWLIRQGSKLGKAHPELINQPFNFYIFKKAVGDELPALTETQCRPRMGEIR